MTRTDGSRRRPVGRAGSVAFAGGSVASSELDRLDEAAIGRCQLKVMVISGMGFLADAYDLFVIGTVVAILRTQWHLSTGEVSLLSSTALAASAVGAILFGRIADILGRKRIYGYEVLILAAGALASALAPGFGWLLGFRIVLGLGIGGDYPVSATMMSEYAGRENRGRLVGLVFSMQALGLILGPSIAVVLLHSGVSRGLTWRLLLALGAVPGLSVYRMRRTIHETPRYALRAGAREEAREGIEHATGAAALPRRALPDSVARLPQAGIGGLRAFAGRPRLLRWLIGGALAWGLLDFAYYGNTIATPSIIGLLDRHATLSGTAMLTLAIFVVAALPGYGVALWQIDRVGRRAIQIFGFAVMAVAFGLMGLVAGVTTSVPAFLAIFGVSYFFTEFGPNMTTFVLPSEMFPLELRTTGHGLCTAVGKAGACAGTFLFPLMLSSWGIRGAEVVAAGTAALGAITTAALLPETRGRSLEQISDEVPRALISSDGGGGARVA